MFDSWTGMMPGEGNGNPLQCSCLGQRSLVGYSPWGHKQSDMTLQLNDEEFSIMLCT